MKKAFAVQSFAVHMRDEKFKGLAKELQGVCMEAL